MLESLPFLGRPLEATAASTVGTVMLRLTVAAALGGVIGLEREIKQRPAGLRTNMFMCFGAAMFTVLSALMAGSGQDQTRIAAQIISGIGFIGAGSILHHRTGGVQGVTTAATIFVVAAIGMCAGAGLMFPAALATVLVLFGLLILGVLEKHVFVRPYAEAYRAEGESEDELYALLELAQAVSGSKVYDISFTRQPGHTQMAFTLEAGSAAHDALQVQLRDAYRGRKILSFSSSEQE